MLVVLTKEEQAIFRQMYAKLEIEIGQILDETSKDMFSLAEHTHKSAWALVSKAMDQYRWGAGTFDTQNQWALIEE